MSVPDQSLPILGYPTSPLQQRLWRRAEADGLSYHLQAVITLRGKVDRAAIQRALDRVLSQNEILRTTFHRPEGHSAPLQIVHDGGLWSLDGEAGPQIRSRYVGHSSTEHSLALTMSPLCADLESVNNLVRQIGAAYGAIVEQTDAASQLPQFADIAQWQWEELTADHGAPGRQFWTQQALTSTPGPILPGERSADGTQRFAPRMISKGIDRLLWSKIQRRATETGTHPQAWLLACWKILLARLTRETSVLVHCYSDGRTLEELADAVGPLGRYVPLRTTIDAASTLSRTARSVHELQERGRQWHHAFGGPADDEALIGTGFDYFEAPAAIGFGGVEFSVDSASVFLEPFTLRLSCAAGADELTMSLHYDGRRHDESDIERLAGQFEVVLRQAAEAPETPVGRLNVLTDLERQTLLVEFNDTAADYPREACIHHFFEQQALQTPDKVALIAGTRQLDYAALNRRANQLARHLQSCAVGPNTLVGICLERSIEMIVGILGVLKAGGAYVPLDPAYPTERLHFMLEDTAAPVIVTSERLVDRLPAGNWRAVCLDRDAASIDEYSTSNVESSVGPQDLVYVIYTSGSTGKPKGVKITHQGLVISNSARITYYKQPVQKFLLLSSFSFDSSVVGLFWPLCTGGALVLVSEDIQKTPAAIAQVVADERVSHLLTLPSFYALILEHARPGQLDSLQTAIVAGEPCSKRIVERHYQLLPGTALFSEYGATENTVFNAVYDCAGQTLDTAPIGRPIANAQIYLLDENLQPVPTGVQGEAYFGGPALSPGYLNRPDLNAERFIPHPFSDDPAARLYRSGDLLRHLPNGDVEFLGRTDHQVKIRGFRIELGEIEAVLLRHGRVREAAVLAVTPEDWRGNTAADPESGGKRLAAYVAIADGPAPSITDLRRFVADQLPDHMVPAAFVVLSSLPKHPNGKIDRRALPSPGSVQAELQTTYEAARSATEHTLVEIWRQVLGLAQVGIHDNYFELGGDSILSIQIVAKAVRAGLSMTPMQIFQHQTIAELAGHVGAARQVTAEQGDVTGGVPLTAIEHWFCEQRSPNRHHWNMPLLLRLKRAVSHSDLQQAAHALLRHHDALRLRLRQAGTGWQQDIAAPAELPPAEMPVDWVDLSDTPASAQQSRFETMATAYQQSLNLDMGPLMRLIVFDFGSDRGQELFWVVHHLAVDIVSWRVLLEDLETALEQLAAGGPVRLPPKTTSFKRWSELLQQYAGTDALAASAAFWLGDDRRNAVPIPVDWPQTPDSNTEESQRRFQVRLSREETYQLLHDVPKAYQTQINEVLLTALLRSVSEWSGRSSVLVDVESHGREEDLFEQVDLSRTVGWFTAHYPVCLQSGLRPDGGASLEETLQSVKQQLRAIPERGFQYGVLRYLTPDRDLAKELRRLPQADINFNYLGQFGQVLRDSSLFAQLPPEVNCGLDRSGRGLRSHLLEVVGWIVDDCLLVDWYYSEHFHKTSTIERLGRTFIEAVRSLLHHKTRGRGQDASLEHDAFGWELPDLEGIAAAIQKARNTT